MAYLATEFAFFGLSVLDLDSILLLGCHLDPSYGKDKDRRKTIPHAEWIKMTPEQQDAIKAQNRQTKKYEFCGKIGHKESQCRSLKNVISELKKENSKKNNSRHDLSTSIRGYRRRGFI